MTTASVPRLQLAGISKTFGHRKVLQDVAITIEAGEIHGVVGQNGSGKSTLAKVVSGYHRPDAGADIRVDGEPLRIPVRLHDLHAAGVSIVYQDLGLLPDRDIVTNVRIGSLRPRPLTRQIRWREETAHAVAALQRLGFNADLSLPVYSLRAADRARVAIARALQHGHPPGRGLIVFDESTRALPEHALADFYATIRALTGEGTSVLLIGHRLSEILEHCDRVSVLRDGRCVAEGVSTGDLSEASLAATMLGHDLAHLTFRAQSVAAAEPAAEIQSLRGEGLAHPFDLTIAPGEIVGLAGLPGSGYERVPYLVSGATTGAHGTLCLGRELIDLADTPLIALSRRGVVLIPENRLDDGLGAEHSVRDNIALPWLAMHGRPWVTGWAWRRREAQAIIDGLKVVPANYNVPVGRLSGGNQQKVLLGKWLTGKPRLLLLHEPTQAVDVRARHDILEAIHNIAARGTPVVVASSEAADLAILCDRILIFQNGAVFQELPGHCQPREVLDTIYCREASR